MQPILMTVTKSGLGEIINNYRAKFGITQSQLAEFVGWPDSRIDSYERDEIIPDEDSLRKIAVALELLPWGGDMFTVRTTLTPEQAQLWLEENGWFKDVLVEYDEKILASVSEDSFKEAMNNDNHQERS